MKKILYTLAFATFMIGILLMSCKPSTKEEKESQEKVQDARENVQVAKDSLAEAKKAATTEEWKAFKQQADSTINDNEAKIAVLKLKIKKTGKSIDAKYQENIDALEQKNKDLKVKVDSYKNQANSDWESFKREFNHDMNEIGQAFKDLTVDNKK
jgi:Na+-transporting methylmalonyl-CoA/oxaloacetate decarboxylase gamma subunit